MMLGNLSVAQIETRLGVEIPEPFRTEFVDSNQLNANSIKSGKWHCFDIPFTIVFGDEVTARRMSTELGKLKLKGTVQIAWT